ncbi:hypothetical protein AWH56_006860 [Anaerobacillus isosaccharinicus]|uniref:Uncharacterized protein n=1 Tax=Anaerobacillus isosaccharinicus TaxID=1532552 RepID=A0A1S2L1R3_9BACI|nr:hypothetical protein [Anaerobacillus isosaccharinicus]MBA5584256.1 hypothetical protein [Anaerobacillus isosaccharinicus]QOY37343.1 hypothetical protein AWH56_006860 [Anaerobacillus isosaccharinicus]
MEKNMTRVKQYHRGTSNERSISLIEVKEIHQNLLNQHADISDEIADVVEQNDYVKLAHLLVTRSKIETAINEIESAYQSEFNIQVETNHCISNALKDAAEKMESKGGDMLLKVTSNLEKLNDSTHTIITIATALSNKTISKGNQLGHDAGRLLIHKTSECLSRLATIIQKRS